MADILITGNLGFIHEEGLSVLEENFRVVLAGEGLRENRKGKTLRCYAVRPFDKEFNRLFDVYSFQTVFFVSGYADGGKGEVWENGALERTLEQCSRTGVEKMVFLSSVESLDYEPVMDEAGRILEKQYAAGTALQAAQLEELADFYRKNRRMKVIILRLPLVWGRNPEGTTLGELLDPVDMAQPGKISLPGGRGERLELVSERDLAVLMGHIAGEQEDESETYSVCSGYLHSWQELGELLEQQLPGVTVVYEKRERNSLYEEYPARLRRSYGWIPLEDCMDLVADRLSRGPERKKRGRRERIAEFRTKLTEGGWVARFAELLAGFVLTEALVSFLSSTIYFSSVDVRLFFVVIMGTIYGIRTGFLASFLACIALYFSLAREGVDWTILFYNVENWIPFMVYLMAGTVTGYVKNKASGELQFAREEYGLLRDKYLFLNEVYQGAIENKGEYKKQILGFKDSFGRIFHAVQKLDNILPQGIFMEALDVMEDILENRSIAIYAIDGRERFGRLVVCSSGLRRELPKSLELEGHREMVDKIREGQVWRNDTLSEQDPVYANGVFRDGRLVMMVIIYRADSNQYAMNYMNIFKILCGLIQTSFLRALEYTEAVEEKFYYPGTSVVKPDKFAEILEIQKEMKEKGVADYVLLRLTDTDRAGVSGRLTASIRATDTIGEGRDGGLYLLLTQVNEESFHYVEARLKKTGITYEPAGKAE